MSEPSIRPIIRQHVRERSDDTDTVVRWGTHCSGWDRERGETERQTQHCFHSLVGWQHTAAFQGCWAEICICPHVCPQKVHTEVDSHVEIGVWRRTSKEYERMFQGEERYWGNFKSSVWARPLEAQEALWSEGENWTSDQKLVAPASGECTVTVVELRQRQLDQFCCVSFSPGAKERRE